MRLGAPPAAAPSLGARGEPLEDLVAKRRPRRDDEPAGFQGALVDYNGYTYADPDSDHYNPFATKKPASGIQGTATEVDFFAELPVEALSKQMGQTPEQIVVALAGAAAKAIGDGVSVPREDGRDSAYRLMATDSKPANHCGTKVMETLIDGGMIDQVDLLALGVNPRSGDTVQGYDIAPADLYRYLRSKHMRQDQDV